MKVVINRCYGGFGLSHEAIMRYAELKGINLVSFDWKGLSTHYYRDGIKDNEHFFYDLHIERNDPVLVQVVEELGKKAFGDFAELHIVEIPDDVNWKINEYDGMESVEEVHRSWS